jgi:hypothetical protein
MPKSIALPPQKRLHELFDYNENTGVFIRKTSRGRGKAGQVAGNLDDCGYLLLRDDVGLNPIQVLYNKHV